MLGLYFLVKDEKEIMTSCLNIVHNWTCTVDLAGQDKSFWQVNNYILIYHSIGVRLSILVICVSIVVSRSILISVSIGVRRSILRGVSIEGLRSILRSVSIGVCRSILISVSIGVHRLIQICWSIAICSLQVPDNYK